MRILIIKLSSIGDLVHSLPFLESIAQSYPHAKIDWVVEEEAAEILLGHPYIERVIVSGRKRWLKNLLTMGTYREIASFLKELRTEYYDIIVDLQGLFKSGILLLLARGKRKIGFANGREGSTLFLKEKVMPPPACHAIEKQLGMAKYLGCDTINSSISIPITDSIKKSLEESLSDFLKEDFAVMNPFTRWRSKHWREESFSLLAERIVKELGLSLILVGSKEKREEAERILAPISNREKVKNLCGKTTLKELGYILSRARLLVTVDSGPMHIGAALGVPVIAIFGPTSAILTGPFGEGHTVIRKDLPCSPCFKRDCKIMTCMKEISVEEVYGVCKEKLDHPRKECDLA